MRRIRAWLNRPRGVFGGGVPRPNPMQILRETDQGRVWYNRESGESIWLRPGGPVVVSELAGDVMARGWIVREYPDDENDPEEERQTLIPYAPTVLGEDVLTRAARRKGGRR